MQNNANEHLRTYGSSSNDGEGTSAFSALHPNNTSTLVETVLEGGSDDDQGEIDLDNDVRVDLSARLSNASNDTNTAHESSLQGLLIDTNGRADFVMPVGALGNASGTPLDGLQNVSLGESTVDEEFAIDGDKDGGEVVVPGCSVPDPTDPDVIVMLASRRPDTDPQSPSLTRRSPTLSTVRFNETVTECTLMQVLPR